MSKTKITKKQRVANAIESHGSITPFYAVNELGEFRLAAKINSLKKDGWEIKTTMERGINKFKEPIRYAKYHFISKPE